jgi:hypothetical protein
MTDLCAQIPSLSIPDKLIAMEALWTSLHQTIEDSAPPDWHRELLEQRLELVRSGQAVYEDWSDVKKDLRNRAS